MPIQITTTTSLQAVDQRLREFEAQFNLSSAEFAADPMGAALPEDVMVEWDFLLMQRTALEEGGLPWEAPRMCFSSQFVTSVEIQEAEFIYDEVAA